MRSRRDFFKLGFLAPLTGIRVDDGYEPAGFITADDFHAVDLDHVTLDGVRIEHVFEANDVEGWVRVYAPISPRSERNTRARYLTGTVRYVYREPEPPKPAPKTLLGFPVVERDDMPVHELRFERVSSMKGYVNFREPNE